MVVLEQLNNFNGMVAFGAALCSVSINRLKASKSRLDKEKQQYYEHFRKVCMDDNRQTAIRAKMRSVNPPCVPFPGTYLTKMFFVEEQNKTFVKDREKEVHSEGEKESPDITKSKRLISFVRCRKVAEIIKELYLYQSQQYMLRAEPSILVGFYLTDIFKNKFNLNTKLKTDNQNCTSN
uniref:Ras-GEF domain-containing protein n=1 Tax=Panagrolaimus davidi TaxID=227884 RepID=A0A914PQE6_9BILA